MPHIFPRSGLALATLLASLALSASVTVQADNVPDYQQGAQWLEQRLNLVEAGQQARNLIFFLGDGMSITTLTAARIYQGQMRGGSGEENFLSFEQFPWSGLVKTYNTNQQTPDSAGTMSALMTGVKTRAGVISIGPGQELATCAGSQDHWQPTLLEIAAGNGLATGVVTTTRITHATPAATYSHSPDRDWENDAVLTAEARQNGCVDIARQLLEQGFVQGLDLAMGGGLANFTLASAGGQRQDEDLTQRYQQQYPQGQLLRSRDDLLNMNANTPILGLFASSHMDYGIDHDQQSAPQQPSLEDMTFAAIRVMQQKTLAQPQGYVLVIEGGRIDHAHHAGQATRALADTLEFADAISLADRLTNDNDTLIVVTADHSHTLTLAGYQKRGAPILGMATSQQQTYTTLGYANGPGAHHHANDEAMPTAHPDYHQAALGPLPDETHGSDDVAVHAKGPGSQWFHGQLEQNTLFHLMASALQLPATQEKQP